MKFLKIYSPAWADAEHTAVNVMIDTDQSRIPTIPFTATPDDTTKYGPAIYQAALEGEFGEIAEYVAPVLTLEQTTARNAVKLAFLTKAALTAIDTIQCSAAAGNPRDGDSDKLLALQQYVDQLRDVDLTQAEPAWPPVPDFLN
ncbi:tail fiber assembly protein [Klebsiella aerogenes]|uniref:tail fiber assembly protein n=1 Tax=Klebsiella aerogenes TaxID=548 RepID=UPI0034D35CF9